MEIITRSEAKALDLKRYFTGEPCKNGHISERSTVNATCFDCKSSYSKKSYNKNPEPAKVRSNKRYYEKKPEIKIKAAIYARENRDDHNARGRKWKRKNPEKCREQLRSYRSRNRDRCKAWRANRRARELGAEGEYTGYDVERMRDQQNGKCATCRVSLEKAGQHIDHIYPLALGGTNWPSNLQLLCPSCNSRKSCKDPIQWANENGRLL